MNTATVVIALIVVAIVALTVVVALRERRARALAARLDTADAGSGIRDLADALREQTASRGEAGGSSWSAAGKNSAG